MQKGVNFSHLQFRHEAGFTLEAACNRACFLSAPLLINGVIQTKGKAACTIGNNHGHCAAASHLLCLSYVKLDRKSLRETREIKKSKAKVRPVPIYNAIILLTS